MSARKAANFVRVNCSAIPAELMESEFFGYAAPGELAEAGAAAVVRTAEELEQFILNH